MRGLAQIRSRAFAIGSISRFVAEKTACALLLSLEKYFRTRGISPQGSEKIAPRWKINMDIPTTNGNLGIGMCPDIRLLFDQARTVHISRLAYLVTGMKRFQGDLVGPRIVLTTTIPSVDFVILDLDGAVGAPLCCTSRHEITVIGISFVVTERPAFLAATPVIAALEDDHGVAISVIMVVGDDAVFEFRYHVIVL